MPMSLSNRGYAMLLLGQWCRNHGIYEIREVFDIAAQWAKECESAEVLAKRLEQTGIEERHPAAAKPQPTPAPTPSPEPAELQQEAPVAEEPKPAHRHRTRKTIHAETTAAE